MLAILRFLAWFLLIWVAGLVLLALFPAVEAALARLTAAHLAAAMPLLGLQPVREGTVIFLDDISFDVEPVCSPAAATLALAAAIFAYPATLGWRLAGAALGAVALWCYNLARLLFLAELLIRRSPWFETLHLYLWQTVTVVLAGALFFLWVRAQAAAAGVRAGPARGEPSA